MKKTTGFEKLDPHKEEFPCDECGAVVKRWTLTYVGTRKLCKDCYDKIPFQCHGCDRVFNRKVTTLHIKKGRLYCDECYQRIFITYQDEERRRRSGYEKANGYEEEYPCPECGSIINTWDLVSDKYGRKVCKDCHESLPVVKTKRTRNKMKTKTEYDWITCSYCGYLCGEILYV